MDYKKKAPKDSELSKEPEAKDSSAKKAKQTRKILGLLKSKPVS